MLGWIIYLVIGGIIGWLASIIMRRDAQQGILMNIIVGIVGSLLGGWLGGMITGHGGNAASGQFDMGSLLWSLIGAVVLSAIVNLITRGRAR